ncbi:hypothetical protein [Roseomonas marmotae]|uniref:Uncharacterized protein n=1 Tax=Roseomonas marmotae TaxID=2768161 RepID=A0ABS3K7Y2_9PROT|nr:hypothetical protein [Roseomonas marmotae]MBO1073579.1 hypothetical protein [Roseomonas marmotae]QTI80239.1 hypothetical protein IAI58_05645 [Roseomonas marmotae]
MRLIQLCLLALFAMALAAPAADAASPRGEARATKVVKPASRAAAPRAAVRPVVARPAATRQPAAARSTKTASRAAARATTGRQTAKATSRRTVAARGQAQASLQRPRTTARGARLASWTAGLPAASGSQRDCPAGTMSTLARGHDDIVRCMPL